MPQYKIRNKSTGLFYSSFKNLRMQIGQPGSTKKPRCVWLKIGRLMSKHRLKITIENARDHNVHELFTNTEIVEFEYKPIGTIDIRKINGTRPNR